MLRLHSRPEERSNSRHLTRSGSIKNLISFYEATYSTTTKNVKRFQKADSIDSGNSSTSSSSTYLRQISSPTISRNRLNFMPASPLSSSNFSPSPSSSNASSTERLSFSTNSVSIDTASDRSLGQKEGNGKEISSASLIWSLSTASSSSNFSSSQISSIPPIISTTTPINTTQIEDIKPQLIKPRGLPTSMSLHTMKQTISNTLKTANIKKNNSFSDLTLKLSNLKIMKNGSLSKLFEKNPNKNTNKSKPVAEKILVEQPKQQRPTELKLFKSISKKVLHTVKLCKLEKFSPLATEISKIENDQIIQTEVEVTTKLDNLKIEPEVPKVENDQKESSEIVARKLGPAKFMSPLVVSDLKKLERSISTPASELKTDKLISILDNGLRPENRIRKSNFSNRSFEKKVPIATSLPSWSAQMSNSYSFSHISKPVNRSQSQRNPSSHHFSPRNTQKIVLDWCQYHTRNYHNVKVSNFSSSWADGLAFCALIHSFMPDSFDYKKLQGINRKLNFDLAFETAHEKAGVIPLLEVTDMLNMGNRPDDRCVFTYVSTIYSRFQHVKQQPKLDSGLSPTVATLKQ